MNLEDHVVDGRYDVKRRLQSGYFGTTWLASDNHVGKDVCLKTFSSDGSSQRKELSILKQHSEGHFEHDHLCRVLHVCIDRAVVMDQSGVEVNRIQYVVFEYCSGSDLFNFLCSGPWEKTGKVSNFSESMARHYFKQIVLGLMYLHERGMYHRDIKPENCVLDSNLNLKLTDFGTNKYFSDNNPMHLVRTKTRGVGTESYRAPEVNSGRSYDPSAADVWSLGVTLFFFVGVEQMFDKAQSLDPYSKQLLAPLGIYFPFPLNCSKLDSYLRTEAELKHRNITGSINSSSLPNEDFWREWQPLKEILSSQLIDLFNRIFVLESSLRITMRDVIRHVWVNISDGLSPDDIKYDIHRRCPSNIRMSRDASPVVMRSALLGGVDQVVLREALSGANKEAIEFPEDSQTFRYSLQLQHLESLVLLYLSGGDIQEITVDIQLIKELMKDILSHPYSEDHRYVPLTNLNPEWIIQLLLVVGFLPKEHTLVLLDEYVDLLLIQYAILFLEGVELAISKSAIYTICGDPEYPIDDNMEMDEVYLPDNMSNNGHNSLEQTSLNSQGLDDQSSPVPPPPGYGRSISTGEQSMDTIICSSQGSTCKWTAGSMSTQSSQDELPESGQFIHDWTRNFSDVHRLILLKAPLNIHKPKQYTASSEFCKMSGLICSYGIYQVVCHDQLAVYCKGNTAYFSVRLVCIPESIDLYVAGLSTWCYSGVDEWTLILDKLTKDMMS